MSQTHIRNAKVKVPSFKKIYNFLKCGIYLSYSLNQRKPCAAKVRKKASKEYKLSLGAIKYILKDLLVLKSI